MRILIALGLVLIMAAVGVAADQVEPKKLSLSLTDVDISEAIAQLSQKAGVSILGDASVKGKVSCQLSDVTTDQALDVICKTNKLEWVRTFAGTGGNERLSAGKLFEVIDTLKELGAANLVLVDSKTGAETIFVPASEAGKVDTAVLASKLNMKPVYLIRAERDPEAVKAQAEKAAEGQVLLAPGSALPADVGIAADQLWNAFGQMSLQQRYDITNDVRRRIYENMTPEERSNMWRQMRDRRSRDSGRDSRDSGRDGRSPR